MSHLLQTKPNIPKGVHSASEARNFLCALLVAPFSLTSESDLSWNSKISRLEACFGASLSLEVLMCLVVLADGLADIFVFDPCIYSSVFGGDATRLHYYSSSSRGLVE